MIKIDHLLLDQVAAEACVAPRRRKNYNFHREYSDTLQRLLNAMEPLSYIQPHKHENPDKREIFFALRGRFIVVEFDTEGNISDHILLDPATGNHGAEIAEKTFHTIIALDPGTVAYEFKDGPYSPFDDKNFAPWAPREGEPEAAPYLEKLLNLLSLQKTL